MEELVNKKDKCCGCGLCAIKCPKNAILIKEDEYGFKYPYINKDKCINCGICKRMCEYNEEEKNTNDYCTKAYAAYSKNESILNSTASGGVFTTIAKDFVEKGGIVFGCSLEKENNEFVAKHIKITETCNLEKIKGSKYIQSDISNLFNEIKNELHSNKKVLFSGTPCQVAAVKAYTKNDDNLFTMDIICHGVPNNKMFNDYINFLNEKNNIQIKDFKFRDKKKGWGLYYRYYYYDVSKQNNYQKVLPAFKSSYYQLFLDSFIYRENCYNCPYANKNRIGDITIGDYWGIEKEHPKLISDKKIRVEKGVSCIIVNSDKGEKLIKYFSNNIQMYCSEFDKIKKHNYQLEGPSMMRNERNKILDIYKKQGFESVDNYYNKKNRIKNIIKSIIKR